MPMRILALIDGSPAALQGARYGARLAKVTGGKVVLLHARSGRIGVPVGEPTFRREEPVLRTAREDIRSIGAAVEEKVVGGTPGDAIPRELSREAYDMVTLGNRGLGESHKPSLFLGSTALYVVRVAQVPVLLVRATEQGIPVGSAGFPFITSILVPTDGSLASLDAADLAARLAAPLHAKATLLHVHSGHTSQVPEPFLADEDLFKVSQEPFHRHGAATEVVRLTGEPATTILQRARDEDYDLIVMGTYGAGEAWYRRHRMGSVAEMVLIGTPCPVILVKHPVATEINGGRTR
ncbi:MAG TPA: universal stress protein [Armatimonadota bacterium]|nr:universal stress protein [Armatimonadota bacterium]